jgi:hypothetical protein
MKNIFLIIAFFGNILFAGEYDQMIRTIIPKIIASGMIGIYAYTSLQKDADTQIKKCILDDVGILLKEWQSHTRWANGYFLSKEINRDIGIRVILKSEKIGTIFEKIYSTSGIYEMYFASDMRNFLHTRTLATTNSSFNILCALFISGSMYLSYPYLLQFGKNLIGW